MQDGLSYWRLVDPLSVVDAVLLALNVDPATVPRVEDPAASDAPHRKHTGFKPLLEACRNAVLSDTLKAQVDFRFSPASDWDPEVHSAELSFDERAKFLGGPPYSRIPHSLLLAYDPDWTRSTVYVADFRAWLRSKEFFPPFYFSGGDPDDPLNPDHPQYSAKLACAVAAWKAIDAPTPNRTIKQTVDAWVRANAAHYGLAGEDGSGPSSAAVEEISKVVNWQPQGGAARTGGVRFGEPAPLFRPDQ